MNPGEVVIAHMPGYLGGTTKQRPALLLSLLPGPYQHLLLCGISTQLTNVLVNRDEPIQPGDKDFPHSGLHRPSIVRLSYLHAVDKNEVLGVIGLIDPARLDRLRTRQSDQVRP